VKRHIIDSQEALDAFLEEVQEALEGCRDRCARHEAENAELRAALKALLDPETHDPAYDPTFGPGVPSMHAVDRARAALAASEGQP